MSDNENDIYYKSADENCLKLKNECNIKNYESFIYNGKKYKISLQAKYFLELLRLTKEQYVNQIKLVNETNKKNYFLDYYIEKYNLSKN